MCRMPDPPAGEPSPRLTIILPTYHEETRIGSALEELRGYLNRDGPAREGGRPAAELGSGEGVVGDDGSHDGTVALVEARANRGPGRVALRLMREPHRGKGGAVRAGMLAARSELVVFADADMATPPDQLPKLVAALAENDVALGSRVQPDGSDRRSSQPFFRRLLGRFFHTIAALWVTGPVPDTQCGFKGFRTPVAHDLFARQRVESIVFDAEIIHLARRRGYRIVSVPVQWSDKRGSRMRVRPGLALRVLLDLVRIPLLHRNIGPA